MTQQERLKYFRVERFVEPGTSYRYRVVTRFDVTQEGEDVEGVGWVDYSPPRNRGKITVCRARLKKDCVEALHTGKYDWLAEKYARQPA